jgi:pilus assembly protein CpaE
MNAMNEVTMKSRAAAAQVAPQALVYLRDHESDAIVRKCLVDLGAAAVHANGGIEAAIRDLAHQPSPRLLVIDISGTEDPVASVAGLANVCGPETGVVAVGDVNDVALYRSLKAAGVAEYFFKPLVGSLVSGACDAILKGNGEKRASGIGKIIFVMGVHGGVGATGIATWLAWHLAEARHRRAILVDLDVNSGDAALQLDVAPSRALCDALEEPERVDDLFIERGAIHVTERFDLLASLEPLDHAVTLREDAVVSLLENLARRYRYVFVDVPASLALQQRRLLQCPGVWILVSDASLVAARDVARWRDRLGPNTTDRTTLHVVNKAGTHGSLPAEEFNRAIGHEPEVSIPYAREIVTASLMGMKGLAEEGVLGRALAPVLKEIAGETAEEPPSLLKRLFG